MPRLRELLTGETALAHEAMVELRPHFSDLGAFVRHVDELQRPEGYRLVASFEEHTDKAVAVAGFWAGHNLALRSHLYVDDLVTLAGFRGRGHADALMRWLFDEARRLDCDVLHLDSATHRHAAHRFYLKHDLAIVAFHFTSGELRR